MFDHLHGNAVQRADLRGLQHVVGRAARNDAPVLHGHHMISVVRGVVDVVQDDDDGFAEIIHRLAQIAHEVARVVHVEVVQRFIEKDIGGVLRENHRHQGALALPAGQFVDKGMAQFAKAEVIEWARPTR